MDEAAKNVARRAAGQLAFEFGPALPAMVERELLGGVETPTQFGRADRAIALAALIVSASQLGWQVYHDMHPAPPVTDQEQQQQAPKASAETLARRIRVQVDLPPGISEVDRDQLIRVVVDEVLASALRR